MVQASQNYRNDPNYWILLPNAHCRLPMRGPTETQHVVPQVDLQQRQNGKKNTS